MANALDRYLTAQKKKYFKEHADTTGTGGEAGKEGWESKLDRDRDWINGDSASRALVDMRDPDFGLTPLHYACKTSYLKVVQVLLRHGANPNIRAPDGRTALHFAAAYRFVIFIYSNYPLYVEKYGEKYAHMVVTTLMKTFL
jgi:hypothetical protein